MLWHHDKVTEYDKQCAARQRREHRQQQKRQQEQWQQWQRWEQQQQQEEQHARVQGSLSRSSSSSSSSSSSMCNSSCSSSSSSCNLHGFAADYMDVKQPGLRASTSGKVGQAEELDGKSAAFPLNYDRPWVTVTAAPAGTGAAFQADGSGSAGISAGVTPACRNQSTEAATLGCRGSDSSPGTCSSSWGAASGSCSKREAPMPASSSHRQGEGAMEGCDARGYGSSSRLRVGTEGAGGRVAAAAATTRPDVGIGGSNNESCTSSQRAGGQGPGGAGVSSGADHGVNASSSSRRVPMEELLKRHELEDQAIELTMQAMWATNVVDIYDTLGTVCSRLLYDKSCSRAVRRKRALALR